MGSPEFLTSLVTGGDIWGCNPCGDVCVAIHRPAEKSIKHPGRSRTDVTQARRYVMANGDSNKPGRTPDARKPGHDQIPGNGITRRTHSIQNRSGNSFLFRLINLNWSNENDFSI